MAQLRNSELSDLDDEVDYDFRGLLTAAKREDVDAFGVLYGRYKQLISAFVVARGITEFEDVVSETFIGAFRTIGNFEGTETEFRAWLFRIARNKIVDWYRRRGRRPITVGFPPGFDSKGGDVEDDAVAELAHRDLLALFGSLTSDQAEVLVLRLIGDLTIVQIAAITGRSPGAVKAHQRRALRRLQAALDEMAATK